MSGPAALADFSADLVGDPGALTEVPTVEWHGWQAVARTGGVAVVTWRSQARAAAAAGIVNQQSSAGLCGFAQAVVRIGKGRDATLADLAAAWQALAPGGRLLIAGQNDIGIATWAKRLSALLGVSGTILVNRGHGRVVEFPRNHAVLPAVPPACVQLPDGRPLSVDPGVFSADGLDEGTALLLDVLATWTSPNEGPIARIVDVGCGAGHLGIAAATRWPSAEVLLLDADARAVACAAANATGSPTITVTWWDDQDPWPWPDADLALLNPPCHAGSLFDLTVARRLFAVTKARHVLVVANRQLAYEADLHRLGELRQVADNGRFKVLELTRF